MSRWLPDRLYVSLAPESVALARVARLLRPRLVAKHIHECAADRGAERWRAPVAALADELKLLAEERLSITVVLSNCLVRYAAVPFDPAISSAREELALARFHFARLHGERAKSWDLRVSEGPAGCARLACAVDAGLLEAIRGCLPRGARARFVSIQPYLMSAFNRCRRDLPAQGAWLVLPERAGACLAFVSAKGWRTAQSLRLDDASGDWPTLVERERLRAADETSRTVIVHGESATAGSADWLVSTLKLPPLDGFSASEDRRYAMALSAR